MTPAERRINEHIPEICDGMNIEDAFHLAANKLDKAREIFKKYHDQILYYKDELPTSWLDIANESAKWIEE